MNISETKSLLRKHRITPNRLSGQNFLVDNSFFHKMAEYASLNHDDVILDVGAGFGFLTRFLSYRGKRVIAIEKDPIISEVLHVQLRDLPNVTIITDDVLKTPIVDFDKIVSVPPYQISSRLLNWLFYRNFEGGVLILQKEFVKRIMARIGTKDYGWLTVFTYFNAEIDLFDNVPKEAFYPQPDVASVIVHIKPRKVRAFQPKNKSLFRQMVRSLFSERNKKVANAITPFLKKTFGISSMEAKLLARGLPYNNNRVRVLTPENFGTLANAIID